MKTGMIGLFVSGCLLAGCGEVPGDESPAGAGSQGQVESVSSDLLYLGPTMVVTVRTGGDDLRGDSSVAMISFQRSDGTWSSEKAFSKNDGSGKFLDTLDLVQGANELPNNSTWQYTLGSNAAGWDGFDACAKAVRVRLKQGSCFGCTDDNWNISWLTVNFQDAPGATSWRMATITNKRLTGSVPSVTVSATQTPAGEVCANGNVADCNGLTNLTASTAQAWDVDGHCDDGGYGAFLVCSAFKFDSGLCGGLPSGWNCPSSYYGTNDGCDCNCGAWDPDCNSGTETLYGCSSSTGMTCANNKLSPGVYAPQCVTKVVVR